MEPVFALEDTLESPAPTFRPLDVWTIQRVPLVPRSKDALGVRPHWVLPYVPKPPNATHRHLVDRPLSTTTLLLAQMTVREMASAMEPLARATMDGKA